VYGSLLGRNIRAIGSNPRAARIANLKIDRARIGAFVASGVFSAFGGVLLSYSLATASATGVADVLLPVITATILGAIGLSGGRGNPLQIVLGLGIIGVLEFGLNNAGLETQIVDVFTGGVLLVVAAMESQVVKSSVRRIGAWKTTSKAMEQASSSSKSLV